MQVRSVPNPVKLPAFGRAVPLRQQPPSETPELGQDERRELQEWTDRFRPELGQLQSPPVGQGSLEQARRYVDSVLRKVAGPELEQQGLNVRVEVFSGDIPQASAEDDVSRELTWNVGHEDRPWPLRTWYGVPQGKPFYRVAVNAGLLRSLKSEDELAFMLSHQVTHLLMHQKNDPTNQEELRPQGQSFLEPGSMQAGADREAVDRMVRAGFNPHGALTALERLYQVHPQQYSKDDQKRALQAASDGHEHEGLRVALVQTQVENYKRSGHPTTHQAEIPLPANLVAPGPGLYEKPVEDFPRFQQNFNELADQLTQGSPAWMFDPEAAPPQLAYLRRTDGSTQDYEAALLGVTDHLQGQPQGREALLRLLLVLEGKCIPEDHPFQPETLVRLQAFLQPDFAVDGFLASLSGSRPDGAPRSLHREFVENVQFNPTFQQFAGSLNSLAQSAPQNFATDSDSGQVKLEEIAKFYKKNQDDPQSERALAGAYNQATRDFAARQNAAQLAQEVDSEGVPRALSFSNQLLSTPHQDTQELEAMRTALGSVLEAAHGVREDHARLRLRPPLAEPQKVTAYLKALFASETWGAFTPAFQEQLGSLLLDVTRTTAGQDGLLSDVGRPQALEGAHERRLCQLLTNAQGADRAYLLRTLSRHWSHELRVPTSSPRRAWTEGLARELAGQPLTSLTQPDRSQHAHLIESSLIQTYGLKPEDIPDTSTATLKAIDERRKNGEFLPKQADYPDYPSYAAALEDYHRRVDEFGKKAKFLAPSEARLTLSPMAIVGHDLKASAALTDRIQLKDFREVLGSAEEAVERSKTLRNLGSISDDEPVGVDAGAFLFEGLVKVQGQIEKVDDWYSLCRRTKDLCSPALEARPSTRKQLGDNLYPRLEALETDSIRTWLGKKDVLDILAPEQSASLLVKTLGERCKPGAPVEPLASGVAELDQQYKLQEEYPVVYKRLRDLASEQAKLQPSTVDTVFPPDPRNTVEEVAVFGNQVRGLSGLLAIARGRSPQEQIDTVEYLMGRQKVMPGYLETASEQQSFAPIAQSIRNVRSELAEADPMVRVVVANSFLAGPSGIMRNEEGREAVLSHFMSGLPEKHKALARLVGESILKGQGDSDTLAVAYMLGQKPKPPAPGEDPNAPAKLDMASMLSRLFDSYGVPGIKMKQYLAFTSEFADFREAFESAQDAAMPLNYYQVLKLIQKRFGDQWPADLKVERILGSGSVNIAIRYFNAQSNKTEVVSLGRQDIEETTRYDFDRFQRFLNALTEAPEDKERFGYILGLLNLIQDSVRLEFDKESVLGVQKQAYQSYSHKVDGWTVRSIDAYKVQSLGLFMEEAKGKTARKIFTQNPKLYREAMRPMAQVEMGILRGQDKTHNWVQKPLFANPDFHDGQVLVDEPNRTVTILDFGQAVPIDNEQRECALDLLTVIGKGDSAKAAAKRLNKRFFEGKEVLNAEDFTSLIARKERMDIFIHLLSTLNQKGADVPISAVHWVLGLNRQIALGKKLDQSVQTQVRNMVLTHKMGLPLSVYNTAHAIREKVSQWTAAVTHALIGWAIKEKPENDAPKPSSQDDYSWKPHETFEDYETPESRHPEGGSGSPGSKDLGWNFKSQLPFPKPGPSLFAATPSGSLKPSVKLPPMPSIPGLRRLG